MAFTAVPPSTAILNGNSDTGEERIISDSQAYAQTHKSNKSVSKTKSVTSSASTTSTSNITSNTSTEVPQTTTTIAVPIDNYTSSSSSHTFDPVFGFFIPLLLLILILWAFWKFMMYSIKKNPPYGGYAHKHKRMHPGRPKPKVFRK